MTVQQLKNLLNAFPPEMPVVSLFGHSEQGESVYGEISALAGMQMVVTESPTRRFYTTAMRYEEKLAIPTLVIGQPLCFRPS